jgi:hypothetical protein
VISIVGMIGHLAPFAPPNLGASPSKIEDIRQFGQLPSLLRVAPSLARPHRPAPLDTALFPR